MKTYKLPRSKRLSVKVALLKDAQVRALARMACEAVRRAA